MGIKLKYILSIKSIKRKNNYYNIAYLFINFIINIFDISKYCTQLT